MSLKKKMASILLLIMLLSSLVYFAVFKLVVFKGFIEAENSDAVLKMHQFLSVLDIDIQHLDNFVHDWSSWDSTYTFTVEEDQKFIKENLSVTLFLDQGLSLVHLYDRQGRLVWGKTYDLETGEEIPLDLEGELPPELFHTLITQNDPEQYVSGIIQTGIGNMMIASHPVLTSENAGPSRGALVMGRLFTRDSIASLAGNLGVNIEAWSTHDRHMSEALEALIPSLMDPESVRLEHASADILHAYSLIRDIGDQPAITLKASFPRTITQRGMRAYRLGLLFILGVGLLVFISISGILGGYILNPISRLTEYALAIGVSTTGLKGLDTGRTDEIGVLSREFAAMVERLIRSEERYRIIAENARDVIWVSDLHLGLTYVSPSVVRLRGFTAEETLAHGLDQILAPKSYSRAKEILDRGLTFELNDLREVTEWTYSAEFELRCKDGSTVWTDIVTNILFDETGKPQGLMGIVRDIGERRRLEEQLKQRTDAMESAIDGIAILDEKEEYIYLNKAHADIYGYRDAGELVGKSWRILYDSDELERFGDQIMPELRHRGNWQGEATGMQADGKKFPQYLSLTALDSGGLICVVRDNTTRKQAEDALKESEKRYRTIFESTATANVIVDEATTILMVNKNFAKLSGYSQLELQGKSGWIDFIHEDDRERMLSYHEKRRLDPESPPSSYEFRARNRNGDTLNLLLSTAMIPETQERVVSMIDITELKNSERARIESETRFQQLAKLLPETVYEVDTQGVLTFVNQTWFEKFGYVTEDLSRGMTVFDISIPADHNRIRAINQRLLQGESVGLGEYTARKKDGSTFPALVHATAILREGKFVGSRGFIVDISEKKHLENQLLKAQKMEAIGTLAGGIAHDFNNLLMGILGNISLVLFQVDQQDPIYDRLKSVEGYVQRGSDLTKQLLGFARGGKYEVRPTDLGAFISESSELFGRTKKDIHIHHKTQEGLWTVEVDRGQMEQVLLNLYVNAWHAMPQGGDLYLCEENVELDDVSVSPYEIDPGRFVKVTVTDTGMGMDEATKSRIFEPFFTTRGKGRGTGLGLASAYGIIKNHGGFIHVESEKGVGTSFMIHLPASEKDADQDRKAEETFHTGRETVLLIDDEEMILDVSARMLEKMGYQVIVASGGEVGVQTYAQNKDSIDLVILDMIMPDLGGRDTFEMLTGINPFVKILLSSGYSLDGQAKELLARGCQGFIQKPFTMKALSEKIREILDEQA